MVTTWQSMLTVLAVAGAVLFAGAPVALAEPGGGGGPDPTSASTAERVSAEVTPAVMYVQVDVHTWMRDLTTNIAYPIQDFTVSCTGVAVAPNGVVATAGHCVNEQDLLETVADREAQGWALRGEDYGATFAYYMANYKLEGDIGNSPPDLTIRAFHATDAQDQPGVGMPAQVIDQKSNAQGDVALLKVDTTNLPTAEVVPSDAVNTGTAIMSVGYPASRDAVVDVNLAPSWKDGAVSSRQNRGGVPFLEITSSMGRGMSGGPTVNDQGQVVGINSMGATDLGDSSNFVAPSSALLDMMARNGIRSAAGPVDVAYRGALDEYFSGRYSDAVEGFQRVLDLQPDNTMASEYRVKALTAYDQFGDEGSLGLVGWLLVGGGAFLLLVAGGVALLLVRRSRRRRAGPDAQGGAPQPTQPFVGPLGHGADVPAPRSGDDPLPVSTSPFGTTPFGDQHAPPSPPVGFPSPTAVPSGGNGSATPVAGAATATVSAGFCPHCGTARTPGARFCGNCGHPS